MRVPVVVVGAGPTGLAVGNFLGQAGIQTLILERNPGLSEHPKAISIDDEGLRICQAMGLQQVILEHVLLDLEVHYLSRGKFLAKVAPREKSNGYPFTSTFYQPEFEKLLFEGIQRFPCIDLRFQHTLIHIEQDESGVAVFVQTASGEQQRIECDYLLACDGGKSTVRHLLNIPLRGTTFAQKWLVIDVLDNTEHPPLATFFCDPARPAMTILAPEGHRRWEFMLLPGETDEQMTRPETVQQLIQEVGEQRYNGLRQDIHRGQPQGPNPTPSHPLAPTQRHLMRFGRGKERTSRADGPLWLPRTLTVLPPISTAIQRSTVYTFHAARAEQFHQGRVFLLGDAAHLMPPFGGQGMNSGLRDAHNLAWKLALVLQGQADESLLNTYEQERMPHVTEMIRFSTFLGSLIMPTSYTIALLRDIVLRTLTAFPLTRTHFTEAKIRPRPPYKKGFLARGKSRLSRRLEGTLLPQPHIGDDDVLGNGFALLYITDMPEEAVDKRKREFRQRLQVRIVHVRPQSPLGKILRCPAGTSIIVRPDRYIFSVSPPGSMDEELQKIF